MDRKGDGEDNYFGNSIERVCCHERERRKKRRSLERESSEKGEQIFSAGMKRKRRPVSSAVYLSLTKFIPGVGKERTKEHTQDLIYDGATRRTGTRHREKRGKLTDSHLMVDVVA